MACARRGCDVLVDAGRGAMRGGALLLVGVHALSCWSDRLWDFAFPALAAMAGEEEGGRGASSAHIPAVFTLVRQLATLGLAGRLGSALDGTRGKMWWARAAIVGQNGAVVLLTLAMMHLRDQWLLAAVVGLGCLASVSSLLFHALVSFDWIRVIAATPDERLVINARVRQVYLSTKILAPLGVAVVVSTTSSPLAALKIVCVWNVISGVLELAGLEKLYRMIPSLSATHSESERPKPGGASYNAWYTWAAHPMALFSLSYALLYVATMCPGALLHARLATDGVSVASLSVFQTGSSLCGLVGTWLAPRLAVAWGSHLAIRRVLGAQLVLLATAALFFVLRWSYVFFLGLVALSRIALWAFDVMHADMMQSRVERLVAGRISTVQMGICELFALLPAVFVIGAAFEWAMALHLICLVVSFVLVSAKLPKNPKRK